MCVWRFFALAVAACGRIDFPNIDAALIDGVAAPPWCNSHADCAGGICDAERCRSALHCKELLTVQPSIGDGAYSIDPDGEGGAAAFVTFCDMTVDGGGWSLVGKTDGMRDMYSAWLVSPVNAYELASPSIGANTFACIDAVSFAVNAATEIRLSNEPRSEWVRWSLPAGRTTATFWQQSVGLAAIAAAPTALVSVTGAGNTVGSCYQNDYGILPADLHGGSYPYTSYNTVGNTGGNDNCMSVGVMVMGTNANGYGQNGNGFDAPSSDITWPNPSLAVPVRVGVWLR